MEQEKNPIVAAVFALLPGLGHFYMKDTFYAIVYFMIFWVALFITLVWLKSNDKSLHYLFGYVAIWLYGIYDAYYDCKRYNASLQNE